MTRKLEHVRHEEIIRLLDKTPCICYLYDDGNVCNNCWKIINFIGEVRLDSDSLEKEYKRLEK